MSGSSLVEITEFDLIWSSKGLTGYSSASIWRPKLPRAPSAAFAFCRLGDVVVEGFEPPRKTVVVLSDLSDGVVRKPSDYELISVIRDKDSTEHDSSFWRPIAPPGYVALGDIASPTREKPPSDAVACVLRQCVLVAPLGDQLWTSNDDISGCAVWNIDNGFSTFLATNSSTKSPDHVPARLNPDTPPVCALDFIEATFTSPRLGITVKDGIVIAIAATCVARNIYVGDRITEVGGLSVAGGSDSVVVGAIKSHPDRPLVVTFCRNVTSSNQIKSKTADTKSRAISSQSANSDGFIDLKPNESLKKKNRTLSKDITLQKQPPKVPPRRVSSNTIPQNITIQKKRSTVKSEEMNTTESQTSNPNPTSNQSNNDDNNPSSIKNNSNKNKEGGDPRQIQNPSGTKLITENNLNSDSLEKLEDIEAEELAQMLLASTVVDEAKINGIEEDLAAQALAERFNGKVNNNRIQNEAFFLDGPPGLPKSSLSGSTSSDNTNDAVLESKNTKSDSNEATEASSNAAKAVQLSAQLSCTNSSDDDSDDWENVENSDVTTKNNENLNLQKLYDMLCFKDLNKKLGENFSEQMMQPNANRRLLFQGLLTKKGTRSLFRGNRKRIVYLFNDVIVVAEDKLNRKGLRVVHGTVQVNSDSLVTVYDLASNEEEAPFSFKISDPKTREYIFIADSNDEKLFWLDQLMVVFCSVLSDNDPRKLMVGFKHTIIQGTLHSACVQGRADLLKTLIDAKLSKEYSDEDNEVENNLRNILVDVNDFDDQGYTPLHYTILYKHTKCLKLLLDNNKNSPRFELVVDIVSNRTPKGRTPLCIAASVVHVPSVIELLKSGAAVGFRDVDQLTPLHISVNIAIDEEDNSSDAHRCVGHLLHYGVVVQSGNSFRDSVTGDTLLSTVTGQATRSGAGHIVKLLMDFGADPNKIRKSDGNTPLITACSLGGSVNVDVVKHLLAAGAQPNLRNKIGRTALHTLLQAGKTEKTEGKTVNTAGEYAVLMTLLSYGARLDVEDDIGVPATQLCSSSSLSGLQNIEKSSWGCKKAPKVSYELTRMLSKDALHLLQADPRWIQDNSSDVCLLCNNRFGLRRRRHHCKNCGLLVCYYCCTKEFPLALMDMTNPPPSGESVVVDVRDTKVCDGCFNSLCSRAVKLQLNWKKESKQRIEKERKHSARVAAAAAARKRLGLAPDNGMNNDLSTGGRRTQTGAVKSSARSANSSLFRARDAANKRGEALSELGDRSSKMASTASEFHDLCKALNAKQEKKIFGIW